MPPVTLRQRDLARIHLFKKQLGLDDGTYRELLSGLTGKSSTREMTRQERWILIQEMTRLAAQPPVKRAIVQPDPPPPEKARLLYKIESLLARYDRPWTYANAMAKRMFNLDLIQWCDPDQLRRIVAALVYDSARHRVERG